VSTIKVFAIMNSWIADQPAWIDRYENWVQYTGAKVIPWKEKYLPLCIRYAEKFTYP